MVPGINAGRILVRRGMKKMEIEIVSGPDNYGRYRYWKKWRDSNPACCLTCGSGQEQGCECYGRETTRWQIYRASLPKEA